MPRCPSQAQRMQPRPWCCIQILLREVYPCALVEGGGGTAPPPTIICYVVTLYPRPMQLGCRTSSVNSPATKPRVASPLGGSGTCLMGRKNASRSLLLSSRKYAAPSPD